uniref:GDNF/GAS1 domain-containing protein n=1 Tax=Dicentrarchus labrax TaxID=13489 RepID=A0A8C4ICL1_DICLA
EHTQAALWSTSPNFLDGRASRNECYCAVSLSCSHLICWQALLRCHDEPECELAYSQYLAACEGNIRGTRRQCPSHCINALIRLNHTRSGPDLETCDCAQDLECLSAKRAVEPCLPRRHPSDAGGIGCMEARQRCEEDSNCHTSLTAYLSYCGQLFNGRKCSSKCKATIQQMLFIPNGVLLNRCVCDGVERPFCEVVKENMSKLCSIGDHTVISDQPDQPHFKYLWEQSKGQARVWDQVLKLTEGPSPALCLAPLPHVRLFY